MTFQYCNRGVSIGRFLLLQNLYRRTAKYRLDKELQMVTDEEGVFVNEGPILAEGPIELDLEGPITLDLGAVKDELAELGWHSVRIERADAGISSKKGLPKIFVMARMTDQDDPDFNRTLVWNCMLSGDGLVFTKRCFKAADMPEQLNYPTYQALADDLVGRELAAKVQHKANRDTGEMQVSVGNWKPIVADLGLTLE